MLLTVTITKDMSTMFNRHFTWSIYIIFILKDQILYGNDAKALVTSANIQKEVTALDGGPLTLTWTSHLSDLNISWCYWQQFNRDYRKWETFLSWDNINKRKENLSPLNVGWQMMTTEPCMKGIRRNVTNPEHGGVYQLVIRDSKNLEYTVEYNVHFIEASLLSYNYTISGTTYKSTIDKNLHPREMIILKPSARQDTVSIELTLSWPSSYPTIRISDNTTARSTLIQLCSDRSSCSADIIVGDKEYTLDIEISTDIQGAESVRFTQYIVVFVEQCHMSTVITLSCLLVITISIIIVILIYSGHQVNKRGRKGLRQDDNEKMVQINQLRVEEAKLRELSLIWEEVTEKASRLDTNIITIEEDSGTLTGGITAGCDQSVTSQNSDCEDSLVQFRKQLRDVRRRVEEEREKLIDLYLSKLLVETSHLQEA